MRKPPTGEPCAGKPPARFGGRGGRKPFPTPTGQRRVCARGPGHRQAGLIRSRQAEARSPGPPRAGAAQEQPGRELASADTQASARCSASSRPDRPSAFCPPMLPFTTRSTPSATSFPPHPPPVPGRGGRYVGGGHGRVSFGPEFARLPLAFSSRDSAVRPFGSDRYRTLSRNARVRASRGWPNSSAGGPCSTMRPRSVK